MAIPPARQAQKAAGGPRVRKLSLLLYQKPSSQENWEKRSKQARALNLRRIEDKKLQITKQSRYYIGPTTLVQIFHFFVCFFRVPALLSSAPNGLPR